MNDVYNIALDENLEEAELGQIHALHLNENAIHAIRLSIAKEPSLSHCMDCGEEIPEPRRLAILGVTRCIHCQTVYERNA